MKITEKYIFFYKEWPGNYTRSFFYWNAKGKEHRFFCTEQAFMYAKAVHFCDFKIAKEILESNNANECRLLGRKVHNYNDNEWSSVRRDMMYECNFAKYSQDQYLKHLILKPEYENRIFVEASPIDRIWGIGMDENNPLILDRNNWLGLNMLGFILTEIRKELSNGK